MRAMQSHCKLVPYLNSAAAGHPKQGQDCILLMRPLPQIAQNRRVHALRLTRSSWEGDGQVRKGKSNLTMSFPKAGSGGVVGPRACSHLPLGTWLKV